MIGTIWLVGAVITFLTLLEFRNSISNTTNYLDEMLGESSDDKVLFLSFILISLGWPLVIVLMILSSFNENS